MNIKNLNLHNYLLFVFTAGILLISCNNNPKNSDTKEAFDLVKSAKDVVENSKELKDIEPVSKEELHNWFPQTLLGMNRVRIVEGTLTGYGISGATAVYQDDGKKKLTVTVNDGAGEKGTMLTSQYKMIKNLKAKAKTGSKSEKILNSDTMLGTETHDKKANNTKIDFLYRDRFSIILDGYDMNKQDTWNAFKELDIDKLF